MADKIYKLFDKKQRLEGYGFHCPGCEGGHSFDSKKWTFDGDAEQPTFTPSLLVFADDLEKRCHLYVIGGRIKYLQDCHHKLAGQTIEMDDID